MRLMLLSDGGIIVSDMCRLHGELGLGLGIVASDGRNRVVSARPEDVDRFSSYMTLALCPHEWWFGHLEAKRFSVVAPQCLVILGSSRVACAFLPRALGSNVRVTRMRWDDFVSYFLPAAVQCSDDEALVLRRGMRHVAAAGNESLCRMG